MIKNCFNKVYFRNVPHETPDALNSDEFLEFEEAYPDYTFTSIDDQLIMSETLDLEEIFNLIDFIKYIINIIIMNYVN